MTAASKAGPGHAVAVNVDSARKESRHRDAIALRKIAEGETGGFGDISTLADPGVVDALLAGRQ